ncbi:sulfotransferase 1 family member D1-like [Phlebotomus argentipes]|uniref:sulfotransferase 1 family member D1-like n=1 Tax=Phlebotomus argentipes TaxID=94469 RepID=UPI002892E5E0|nr:sulfotransferase 1 family member D1-like [Phlebotomus argentipes]
MSVICEEIPRSEIIEKAAYEGVKDFIFVRRKERPKDIKVAEKWSMEPCFLPSFYEEVAQRILDFEVRADDVWIVTYPKCGTTWTQELIWQICNNLNYDQSKSPLYERFPFLEIGSLLSRDWPNVDYVTRLEKAPSPRFIKSHLPAPLLPNGLWTVKPKIVYVARNVKDVAISWYHHHVNIHYFPGSFQDFMDTMIADKIMYSPFHSHIVDFWRMKDEQNILFSTFEDMKKDLPAVIRRTIKFFGNDYSEAQIQTLADHLSFAQLSKNPSVNLDHMLKGIQVAINKKMKDQNYHFIRKGETGSFKKEMTPELVERFNKWTESEMQKLNCEPELRNIFLLNES